MDIKYLSLADQKWTFSKGRYSIIDLMKEKVTICYSLFQQFLTKVNPFSTGEMELNGKNIFI